MLAVCRQLTVYTSTRGYALVDFARGYAELVESLSLADYSDGIFEAHINCLLQMFLGYNRHPDSSPASLPHYGLKTTLAQETKDRTAAMRHVIAYHASETEIETLQRLGRDNETAYLEHASAFLYHRVRPAQGPREDRKLALVSPDGEEASALRQYRTHLREHHTELHWIYEEFLKGCSPLGALKKIQPPRRPPSPAWSPPPPPPPPKIDESMLARLPPCLQRARLNMLRNTLPRDTDLWWQVFPDPAGLKAIPNPDRRLAEESARQYVVNKKPTPARCQTLIGQKRCPLASRDIEDLPAGQKAAKLPRVQALLKDEDAPPQAACALLCGKQSAKSISPAMFRGVRVQ